MSSDRIEGKVLWRTTERKPTDMPCAIAFGAGSLVAFGMLFALIGSAAPSPITDPDGYGEWLTEQWSDAGCPEYRRELSSTLACSDEGRDCSTCTMSLFEGLSADMAVPSLSVLFVFFLSISWIFLLRKFATTMIVITEAVKIACLFYLGIKAGQAPGGDGTFFFVFAVLYAALVFWKRARLQFAGKMIAHAASSLNENPQIMVALIIIKVVYLLQAVLLVFAMIKLPAILQVVKDDATGICTVEAPSWTRMALEIVGFHWIWCTCFYGSIRLSVISLIVGSHHFHPEDKPTVMQAFQTTFTRNLGANAAAALIIAIAVRLKKAAKFRCWMLFSPPHFVLFLICWCVYTLIKMLTKFTLIIHNFTGLSFWDSAKRCFGVMTRHFQNGAITEAASANVLYLTCWVFSMGVTFIAWAALDGALGLETLGAADEGVPFEVLIIGVGYFLFNAQGTIVFCVIMELFMGNVNIAQSGDCASFNGVYPAAIVPCLGALFTGAIAMLFFQYVGGAILDTISISFVCYAIDKDNGADMSNNTFAVELVSQIDEGMVDPATEKKAEMTNAV